MDGFELRVKGSEGCVSCRGFGNLLVVCSHSGGHTNLAFFLSKLSKLSVGTCCVEHEPCIELAGLKKVFDIVVVLGSTCFLDGLDFSRNHDTEVS